jgi:hypothetical protein
MAWTSRLARNSNSSMIEIGKDKLQTWRVLQQVRVTFHTASSNLMSTTDGTDRK